MHKRLVIVTMFALLSACGGSSNDPVVETPTTTPVPPAGPISAAALAEIDNYVQAQMTKQHIPGLSLVVTMDGKPVLEKGYGMANLATKAAVTPATVFQIASITKQFTAAAIMLLVQEGRIGLDQPITRYFPTAPASWNAITVRQLLHHTAGLQRDFPPELLQKIDPNSLPPIDTLIALTSDIPLQNTPGAVHSYSNVGYHLLGFLIEKVSGKYYADFLQERLFVPLGMSSADVIRTTKPVPTMATGYRWDGGMLRSASAINLTPGLIEAEGGLQMSASDLAKWDAALSTERFLTKDSLAQMWTPATLNNGAKVPYGFGWVLAEINRLPFTWHNGSLEGFTSVIERHTREGLGVIVLENSSSADPRLISTRVAAIVKPELDWVTTTDPQPATGVLLQSLISEVARGTLTVDDRFAPRISAALTPAVVAAYVDFFAQWAPVTRFGYIDQTSIDGVPAARYLVRSKEDSVVVGVALDANGKIAYLGLLSP